MRDDDAATRRPEDAGADAAARQCQNCDQPLHGRYCSACGQETVRDLTVRAMLADAVESVFNLDSRVWRTLRELARRPGFLTTEYQAGRRACYVPPLRLYLVSSVLFFASLELAPIPAIARITSDPQSSAGVREVTPTVAVPVPLSESSGLTDRMARAAADPERLNRTFMRALAWAMFLLIPLFAALLQAVWRSRRLLYVYHLVFALHVHAFGFLLMAIGLLSIHITSVGGPVVAQIPVMAAAVFSLVYLVMAARRFYRASAVGAVLRLTGVAAGYMIAFLVTNLLILGLVLLTF